MNKKVVLAFSGGLDTTYCAKYLDVELGLDVYTITVDTGGFSARQLTEIEDRARELGVVEHRTVNVEKRFFEECLKYLIYGNVLRNGTYPLSVSAERVLQAVVIAEYVQKLNADFVAHGSTGAGNDQVRFDVIFNILIPEVKILTPIRDLQLSREQESEYLRKHGIEVPEKQTRYSINQGLWGTSVGGQETLTSHLPLPEEAFPTPVLEEQPRDVVLSFKRGIFTGFDGNHFEHPVEAIRALNDLTAPYGIGRDIHVGDTIIGIKGRVGFEAPAPILILQAHHALEKHVLSKWQLYWKDQLANWYGMLLHEGQFLDPVMRDIEAFLERSQEMVSGKVFVRIYPHRFQILGIESPFDLMNTDQAAYGEANNLWSGEDARGFARILATQSRLVRQVQQKDGVEA